MLMPRACLPRTAHPGEADAADSVTENVGTYGRKRVSRGEVGVELRRVPVRHPGHDDPLHIIHDGPPGLAFLGRLGRDQGPQVARLDRRQHPPATHAAQSHKEGERGNGRAVVV